MWHLVENVFYGAQYYLILPFENDLYAIKRPILKDLMIEMNSILPVFSSSMGSIHM
jgi:hypothetical protein